MLGMRNLYYIRFSRFEPQSVLRKPNQSLYQIGRLKYMEIGKVFKLPRGGKNPPYPYCLPPLGPNCDPNSTLWRNYFSVIPTNTAWDSWTLSGCRSYLFKWWHLRSYQSQIFTSLFVVNMRRTQVINFFYSSECISRLISKLFKLFCFREIP